MTPPSLVDELTVALRGLGVKETASLEAIQIRRNGEVGPSPAFVVAPCLRFAHHFDLNVDLLVYDPALGTVGLVQRLRKINSKVEREVQELIDQATYVRHLLLKDPSLKGRLPLTVDLVLLSHNDPKHLGRIGQALGRIARETSFLEAIGVSLLFPQKQGEAFPRPILQRAFPWLLCTTRAWYASRLRPNPSYTEQQLGTCSA